jgi:hypothetical protein
MGLWTDFITEYKRRRRQLHPDPMDITYEERLARPYWNQFERRDIRDKIRRKNPIRWNRLERDMVWLRRELLNLGLDPDQARWLV